MELTATENQRLLTQLHGLSPRDWGPATDCTGWTVRDVSYTLIASAQARASPLELARQVRAGWPLTAEIGGQHWADGLLEAEQAGPHRPHPRRTALAVAAHLRRGAHRAAAYAREQLGEGSVSAVSLDRGRYTSSRPARARGSRPCW